MSADSSKTIPMTFEDLPLKARKMCAFLVRVGVFSSEDEYIREWSSPVRTIDEKRLDAALQALEARR
jgi:hypothetical protein